MLRRVDPCAAASTLWCPPTWPCLGYALEVLGKVHATLDVSAFVGLVGRIEHVIYAHYEDLAFPCLQGLDLWAAV